MAMKRFIKKNSLILLALAYLLWPLDLIPDIVLPIGLLDDAVVIIFTTIKELNKRKGLKKRSNREIIDGEEVPEE